MRNRWLPPLGDCGSVVTRHRATVERTKGRRPWNRPSEKGGWLRTPRLGNPKRHRPNCLSSPRKGTPKSAWVATVCKWEGAQRTQCAKGTGPKDPGVAAPLAVAGCRGKCWHVTVGWRRSTCLSSSTVATGFTRGAAHSLTLRRPVRLLLRQKQKDQHLGEGCWSALSGEQEVEVR